MINPDLISVRDFVETDIPALLNYWYRSPSGFIESMGGDSTKLPAEADMASGMLKRLLENAKLPSSKLNLLTIVYDQKPIGTHPLHPLVENDYGVFHAHIWYPEFRKQGVLMQSHKHAARIYFERFNLQKIVLKIPIQNIGPLRALEKIGVRYVGEETHQGIGIVKDGTLIKVFEVTRAEAAALKAL